MSRLICMLEIALRLHNLPVSIILIAGNKKPPARFSWKRYRSQVVSELEIRDRLHGRNNLGLAIVQDAASGGVYARDFDCCLETSERSAKVHPPLAMRLPTVARAQEES